MERESRRLIRSDDHLETSWELVKFRKKLKSQWPKLNTTIVTEVTSFRNWISLYNYSEVKKIRRKLCVETIWICIKVQPVSRLTTKSQHSRNRQNLSVLRNKRRIQNTLGPRARRRSRKNQPLRLTSQKQQKTNLFLLAVRWARRNLPVKGRIWEAKRNWEVQQSIRARLIMKYRLKSNRHSRGWMLVKMSSWLANTLKLRSMVRQSQPWLRLK